MRVAVITDEISDDLREALICAGEWGIPHIEIRNVWGRRVPDLDRKQEKELIAMIADAGQDVVAISPGVFKCPLEDFDVHFRERLPASFELASKLGTNMIICFGFIGRETSRSRVIDRLYKAVCEAQKAKMVLVLEGEPESPVGRAKEMVEVVKAINSPSLRINWDPYTSLQLDEEPYPYGYDLVKDYVAHVHLKNGRVNPRSGKVEITSLIAGEIPYEDQLLALKTDDYRGVLSLETHYEPRIQATQTCWGELQDLLKEIGEGVK